MDIYGLGGLSGGVYGAYSAVTDKEGGKDSAIGGASASTGLGLAGADLALGGTEAIPIVGNVVSAATGVYDANTMNKAYKDCMGSLH
jgi:hypothetical protein